MSILERRDISPNGTFVAIPPLGRIEARLGRKLTPAERADLQKESRSANAGAGFPALFERFAAADPSTDTDLDRSCNR